MLCLEPHLKRKVAWAKNAVSDRETARLALDCLDLTSLKGDETKEDIFALCDRAKYNRLASVCLYPPFIEIAKRAIKDEPVTIATVVNFPYGDKRSLKDERATPETTAEDASKAVAAGASQIDIVLAHEDFRSGKSEYAEDLLKACRNACGKDVTMKVILETASFGDSNELRKACKLAIKYGADCLKTSTGQHPNGGATLGAAAILMDEAQQALKQVGVKISGGIQSGDDCAQYMTLARSIFGWNIIKPDTFRIGASGVLKPLLETLEMGHSPGSEQSQHREPVY